MADHPTDHPTSEPSLFYGDEHSSLESDVDVNSLPPYDDDNPNTAAGQSHSPPWHGRRPARPPPPPPLTALVSPVSSAQLKKNRAQMTLLHFVLTYPRWSMSLFLILSSWTVPFAIPSMSEGLHQPFHDLQILAQHESNLYSECVNDTLFHWKDKINGTAQQEYWDSQKRRQGNREIIEQVRTQAQSCANASNDARRLLQTWQLHVPIPFYNYTHSSESMSGPSSSSCTSSDLDQVIRLVRDNPNTALVQVRMASALDAYLATSTDTLQQLVQYARDRSEYDYNYFVGIKLHGAQELVQSFALNLTLPNWDATLLLQNMTSSLHNLVVLVQSMNVQLELQTNRLADFYTSIQSFYTQYQNLYERLETAEIFVRDFLPTGMALPPALDLSGIPLGATLLPSVWEIPDLPNFPIDKVVSDSLQQAVDSTRGLVKAWINAASQPIRQQMEDLQDSLQQLLTLDDYNPPQLVDLFGENRTLDFEIERLRAMALTTKAQVLSAMDGIGTNSSPTATVLPEWNSSTPELAEEARSPLEFLQLDFPTFGLPSLWSFCFTWFWVLEPFIQLARLLRLRKMYNQDAFLELPEISFLLDDDQDKPNLEADKERESTLAVMQLTVLKLLLSPSTYLFLLAIPLASAGIAMWLPHVVRSCDGSREGTLMARQFVAPLVINNASLAGSAQQAAAQSICHENVREVCSRLYMESDWLFRHDLGELAAISADLRASMGMTQVLDRCVDQSSLDEQQQVHCCGLEGFDGECHSEQVKTYCPINNETTPMSSFNVVSTYLTATSCHNEEALRFDLEDSRFHCGALEHICDLVPCDGVDKDLMRSLSIEADCRAELHLVKCALLGTFCVFHCFCLNLAATMAFRGSQRLFWKSLSPNGIQLRTHMNAQGDIVKGAKRADRSARVAVAMRRFEIVGRLQIALAMILLTVWIIIIVVIRHSLSKLNII